MYKALYNNSPINLLKPSILQKKEKLISKEVRNQYICQSCNEPVYIVWGTTRSPHFRHKPSSACSISTGESSEHMKGKKLLYEYFSRLISHKALEIDIERFIPETGQIADVYIKFNNGVQWVIEYQRSNVPPEEIIKRRQLYKKAGIRDIWIVGENVIKEDGMLLCSVLAVGQPLINEFLKSPSLISLDPNNEIVTIYRGLSPLNTRSFTVERINTHNLEDISFNLWGEIFSIEDYLTLNFQRKYEEYQEIMFSSLGQQVEELQRYEIPGYNYKFQLNSEDESIHDYHVDIPHPLNRFLPVELTNLKLIYDLVKDTVTYNGPHQFLFIKGLYPNKWEEMFPDTKEKDYLPFPQWPVTKGWLLEGLYNIYCTKFQTEKEFFEELRQEQNEFKLPHSTKIYWLKKYGLIEQEIPKNELRDIISLEDALLVILKLINKNISKEDVIEFSLKKGLLKEKELREQFNPDLLSKIVVRLKKFIPISEGYHNAYVESKGLWADEE